MHIGYARVSTRDQTTAGGSRHGRRGTLGHSSVVADAAWV